MKILCFTDNHFCEKTSIINQYGTKYSLRLENQLKSLNWLEDTAAKKGCDLVVCLGDFFDKPQLTDQELTALQDIKWQSNIPHYFIVGNHESGENDLQYSSTKVLEGPNRFIIDSPCEKDFENFQIAFLPYIVESNKKSLASYFSKNKENKIRLLFSHNDILGLQMGPIVSKIGFSIDEIEENCSYCINGHLHNGQQITSKILNLGNLTGKDFGENAEKYTHKIIIIDTDNLEFEVLENPYAFNFCKLEIMKESDILELTNKLKSNAVLSLKCHESLLAQLKEVLKNIPQIIDYRVIVYRDPQEASSTLDISDLSLDHLAKFIECCHDKIEHSDLLEQELAEICK